MQTSDIGLLLLVVVAVTGCVISIVDHRLGAVGRLEPRPSKGPQKCATAKARLARHKR